MQIFSSKSWASVLLSLSLFSHSALGQEGSSPASSGATAPASAPGAAPAGATSTDPALLLKLTQQLEAQRLQLQQLQQQLESLKNAPGASQDPLLRVRHETLDTPLGKVNLQIEQKVDPNEQQRVEPVAPPMPAQAPSMPAMPPVPPMPHLPELPELPAMPTLPPMKDVSPELRANLEEIYAELNRTLQDANEETRRAAQEMQSENHRIAVEARREALEGFHEARNVTLERIKELAREIPQASAEDRPGLERELQGLERELRELERTVEREKREFERETRRILKYERRLQADGDARVAFGDGAVVDAGKSVKDLVVLKGDAEVLGDVMGDAVVMAGDLVVRKGGHIHGDAVVMGGEIEVEEGGIIDGEQVTGSLGPRFEHESEERTFGDGVREGLVKWLLLLAVGLMSMTFIPKRVMRMAEVVESRPLATGVAGVLSLLALFPLSVLLAITLVGIPLVPVMWLLCAAGAVVGVAALAQVVGKRVPLRGGPRSAAALLAWGTALVVLGSMPPVVGVLVSVACLMVGFGAAVVTRFGNPELST
ncbi:MAG: hypothetical protein ACKO6N_25140 [Myxococcota bacterium]